MTIDIRVVTAPEALAAFPEFEDFIWGGDDERVSVNVMVAVISEGGVAIGAYDDGRLVGSAFGFPAHEQRVLHSHYLAVHPDLRGSGLGERIKRAQGEWCLGNGYTAMRWTYDPLQLANAHLNLNKLRGMGVSYHVDHYGALGGINGSLPSDRLTVQWELADERPPFAESFVLDVPPVSPAQIAAAEPAAFEARLGVRDAMAPHLADGWFVTGVDRHARTYTLSRVDPAERLPGHSG
jgi:predicted GNAT superfamily acetyltransferase